MLSAERDVMVRAFPNIDSGGYASAVTENGRSVTDAARVYRDLTGVLPEAANIDGDAHFDRHVLASILALASSEGGSLAAQAGLTDTELGDLFSHWFLARSIESSGDHEASVVDADEIGIVRDLLLENRSSDGSYGRWLAAMIAILAVMFGLGGLVTTANVGLWQRAMALAMIPGVGVSCLFLARR